MKRGNPNKDAEVIKEKKEKKQEKENQRKRFAFLPVIDRCFSH